MHFLMRFKAWNGEREELMEKIKKVVTGFDEVEEGSPTVIVPE